MRSNGRRRDKDGCLCPSYLSSSPLNVLSSLTAEFTCKRSPCSSLSCCLLLMSSFQSVLVFVCVPVSLWSVIQSLRCNWCFGCVLSSNWSQFLKIYYCDSEGGCTLTPAWWGHWKVAQDQPCCLLEWIKDSTATAFSNIIWYFWYMFLAVSFYPPSFVSFLRLIVQSSQTYRICRKITETAHESRRLLWSNSIIITKTSKKVNFIQLNAN